MARQVTSPKLSERWAAFVQGAVSIVAAASDADRNPLIVRALGCRVSSDRKQVTVILSSPQAGGMLHSIDETGLLAVVFSEPPTHISVQLKATNAKVTAIRSTDLKLVERYTDAFVRCLEPFGYQPALVRALVGYNEADLRAVTFTPSAAFLQTPGPGAGNTLGENA